MRAFALAASFVTSLLASLVEERAEAHAARGCDGREEGRERGYYHLHRNLNDSLFHRSLFFFRAESQRNAEAAANLSLGVKLGNVSA